MSDKSYRSIESMESPDIGTQGNSGYIWLAYSAFFLIDPIMSHSPRLWVECGVIYAIFLVIYVSYMKAGTTRRRHVLIVAMYVLGVPGFLINTGVSRFFFFTTRFLTISVASTPTL